MGFIWDAIQQYQISNRKQENTTLEERVKHLEGDVALLYRSLERLMKQLEQVTGVDLDNDQRIG